MTLRSLAPEASASTNSATWARAGLGAFRRSEAQTNIKLADLSQWVFFTKLNNELTTSPITGVQSSLFF